MNINIFIMSI